MNALEAVRVRLAEQGTALGGWTRLGVCLLDVYREAGGAAREIGYLPIFDVALTEAV